MEGLIYSEKDFFDRTDDLALQEFKAYLTTIDNDSLKDENFRKNYMIIRKRARKIICLKGKFEINLRFYKNKQTAEVFSPVLNYLGIHSKSPYTQEVEHEVLAEIDDGASYKVKQKIFKRTRISPSSISNINKKYDLTYLNGTIDKNEVIPLMDGQCVYIYLDDAFVKNWTWSRRQKRYLTKTKRIRIITFNLGFDLAKSTAKRKVLAGKKTTYITAWENEKLSSQKTAAKLQEFGNLIYANFANAKLIIGGDGAKWIRRVAKELNAKYILDRFHVVRNIRDFFIKGKKRFSVGAQMAKRKALGFLYAGAINELIAFIKTFKNWAKIIQYINNNFQGLKNELKVPNIGVSAESEVSRLIKMPLSYGSKVFDSQTYENMLAWRSYKINNRLTI